LSDRDASLERRAGRNRRNLRLTGNRLDAREGSMAIPGTWTLHYSWGVTSSYAQAALTFNPDGTFSGAGNGQWRLRDGTLQLSFNTGPAKYGGTVDGNVGSGAMSTFAGLNGVWYLVRQGTAGLEEDTSAHAYDAAGNAL
jgi:hypothetical protein